MQQVAAAQPAMRWLPRCYGEQRRPNSARRRRPKELRGEGCWTEQYYSYSYGWEEDGGVERRVEDGGRGDRDSEDAPAELLRRLKAGRRPRRRNWAPLGEADGPLGCHRLRHLSATCLPLICHLSATGSGALQVTVTPGCCISGCALKHQQITGRQAGRLKQAIRVQRRLPRLPQCSTPLPVLRRWSCGNSRVLAQAPRAWGVQSGLQQQQ